MTLFERFRTIMLYGLNIAKGLILQKDLITKSCPFKEFNPNGLDFVKGFFVSRVEFILIPK